MLKPHSLTKGGEYMDIILSLFLHAVTAFVKVFAKAAAYYILKRIKDKTALTTNKDGFDTIN